jgi:hypothetical protein
MFYVPVLQENGTEAYDRYTMKQPTAVNFIYSVSIITNKMELLNEMNEMMHYEFNAITTYITPNDHPMPLTLEDISDQSEYAIDDRKYYSQTFKIKLRGYIIRKEDYKVERIPSRLVISSHDSDATGIVNRRGKNRREEDKVQFVEGLEYMFTGNKTSFIEDVLKTDDECEVPPLKDYSPPPTEILEETDGNDDCCPPEEDRYYNKVMKVIMRFDDCTLELSFKIDKDMVLETVETKNVYDFRILVNGEVMSLDDGINFYKDDDITVKITREDEFAESTLTLVGYDPEVKFDRYENPETTLDEPFYEEQILINPEEGNNEEITE